LFRSAALSHGPGAVGVILTGKLDDGTAGLQAIKACGGIAIVQDPADAQEPSMPLSAMRHVDVDYCVPLAEMAAVCQSVMAQPADLEKSIPSPLQHEHALANRVGNPMTHLNAIATPSTFVCPDCSGSLWEITGVEPPRFRCHTGHAYTLRTLQHAHSLATDEALWSAFRALQEQKFLLEKSLSSKLPEADAAQWQAASARLEQDMAALRQLIEQHVSPEEP
jgi:two-component system chemotaxis response regulator CheB